MPRIQKEIFKELVKAKLRNLTKNQRHAKRLKQPIPSYPWAYERQYAADVKRLVFKPFIDALNAHITEDKFNRWVAEYSRHDSLHLDDYPDEINRIIGTLKQVPDADIKGDLSHLAVATYTHSKGDWKRQTEKVAGVPFATDEPWWEKTRKAWVQENAEYLAAYPDELIKKINTTIYSGVRDSKTWGQMAAELQGIYDWTDSKAELVARDQIGKLNGQLSKHRQIELGIDMYEWLATGDERMCEICSQLDGKLCRWDDDSVWSEDGGKTWTDRPDDLVGIPGTVHTQCRCSPVAYFAAILDDANDDLDDEADRTDHLDSIGTDTDVSETILSKAFDQLYKTTNIDNTFDIPYLAGYSINRKTIYIDRHFPQYMFQRNLKMDVWKYVVGHERIEDSIESIDKPIKYQHAHQIALTAENACVIADGWDLDDYNFFWQRYLKKAVEVVLLNMPKDLDLQPYEDEDDFEELKKIHQSQHGGKE